jgi:NAD(P)H-hydrate epimerase
MAMGAGGWPGLHALCLDGIFGFQFRPPLDQRATEVLRRVNAASVTLRAAVDLPSGLGDPGAFRADFTYGTGIVKTPVLGAAESGRVRYLDLGFFATATHPERRGVPVGVSAEDGVLTPSVLAPLCSLRPARSDKRSHGHLMVLGGSRDYPGAVLMAVLAALRSGAGLVTALVPESLVPAFAVRAPEAMWVGWPETPDGGLALEGMHLLRARLDRATALLLGPGLGTGAETLALAADVARLAAIPLVLDADALRPAIITARGGQSVLCTPHAGEFARIAGGQALRDYCRATRAVVVLKGAVTRISDGGKVYHSLFGGPVLARGGSGDLLAGLTGGLLAQSPAEPLWAAAAGTVWHGRAADTLARAHGQVAVTAVQLLDFLPEVLRDADASAAPGGTRALPGNLHAPLTQTGAMQDAEAQTSGA